MRNLLIWLTRPFGGPVGSVCVIVGTILVGVMLSTFTGEIQRSPPVSWINATFAGTAWAISDTWLRPAVWFWSMFLLVAVIASAREYHKHHIEARQKEELTGNIDALGGNIEDVKLIARTMPPKGYLNMFASDLGRVGFDAENALHYARVSLQSLLNSHNAGGEITPGQVQSMLTDPREEVNKSIRLSLDAVINLAFHFDQPQLKNKVEYSASIMWVIDPEKLSDTSSRDVIWQSAEGLSYCRNADMFFASADKLLILDENLATNSAQPGPDVDSLKPLCLAYRHNEPEYNLLGAPATLATTDYCHVPDASAIHEALKGYDDKRQQKVEQHYENHSHSRSLLSMPLTGFDAEVGFEEEPLIAVVTLARDTPGIMQGGERAQMFYHQMTPFLALLFRLCLMRLEFDKLEGWPLRVYNQPKSPRSSDDDSV